MEDLFAALAGGEIFAKLDLVNAYLQLPMDEKSRVYTTINTQKGLFQCNILPFGISSAPAIFQRTFESLLQGLPHVIAYIDDMLVTGRMELDHLQNVDKILTRLEATGMRLKVSKCKFLQPEVQYLGHRITKEGVFPTVEKMRTVQEAPSPTNVQQLRSFLGSINFCCPTVSKMAVNTQRHLHRGLSNQWRKTTRSLIEGLAIIFG